MATSSLRMLDIHRGVPLTPLTQLKRLQGFGGHFKDSPPPFIKETKAENKIERKKKPVKKEKKKRKKKIVHKDI